MDIRFPTQHGHTLLKFRLSICFHATCLAAILCLLVGAVLWFLDSKNIYHFDTMFSARRHAEGSVVDVYRDDETVTTIASEQYRFTPSRRFSDGLSSTRRCPSIGSEIFFSSKNLSRQPDKLCTHRNILPYERLVFEFCKVLNAF
ncbi:hypothetical protein KIN20_036126 [Parelaphostrongylus tenuis]|uniref:Uncharacterized protein n=1 Tax=Parelaphostrongylus tenuis TaxID=148309 RepID=A0AAD5WKF4_PARTN|nr:hypothetical protein KIN20_036126 [Parelaphostrongylus tenuis]